MIALMLLALFEIAQAATTPDVPPPPPRPGASAPPPAPTTPAAPPAVSVPPAPPAASTPKAPPAPTVAAPPPAPASTPAPPAPASSAAKLAKEKPPAAVTLTGPSVVIFHASRADIAKAEPETDAEKEEQLAFRKDFAGGATKLQEAMRAHPQVKVIESSADVVRFSDPKMTPVWRYSVGTGYGYVFYQPGKPLRVFSGARGGDGLVCEATRVFDLKPRPANCDP
jgi:hypothetical protein